MKEVIILRVVQGSGKSTFATLLHSMNPNSVIHETDSYFVNENGEYVFDPSKLQENHDKNFVAFCNSIFNGAEMVIVSNVNAKKELIDYYKQSLKEQEPKKFVIDIFNRDSSGKYHSIITAFALELDEIRTDHICLVNIAYQQGYEIYIYDNTSKRSYNIRDLTDKELKPHHNIEKMLLANHFNSYFNWRF